MEEESGPLRRRTRRDRSVARSDGVDLTPVIDRAKAGLLEKFPTAQFSDTYVGDSRATCLVTDIDCRYDALEDVRIWPAQLNINNGSLQVEAGAVNEKQSNVYYKLGVIWALFLVASCLVMFWVLQNYSADKPW